MVKVPGKEGEEGEVGVMMGWEEEIMRETVRKLTEGHPSRENLTVLNVGFVLVDIETETNSGSPIPISALPAIIATNASGPAAIRSATRSNASVVQARLIGLPSSVATP